RASAVFALGRRRTQVRSRLRQLPEDPTTSPQGAPRRLAQAACAGGLQGSAATAAVTASLPQRPGELGEDVGAREDVVRGDAALPRRTVGEPAGVEEEGRLGRVTAGAGRRRAEAEDAPAVNARPGRRHEDLARHGEAPPRGPPEHLAERVPQLDALWI